MRDYRKICKPLTNLLKKDNFTWTTEAEIAFDMLKSVMISPRVLALPNFNDTFILETDASGAGIGAVLMQKGHPIAFISKALSPRNMLLSAYERELLAVIRAVTKWHQYLIHQPFVIKADQQSSKYLLEHKVSTPF